MYLGILAGLTTCALWGLTFVAPRAISPFTAWDLAVARYGLFGLLSVAFMFHPRFRPRGLSRRLWGIGFALGGLGHIGYFVAVAYAVKLAGAAIPPLIIGLMPVVLALIANAHERTVLWRSLAPSLAMIFVGAFVVNIASFCSAALDTRHAFVLGTISAAAGLAIWVVYGLVNAVVMRAADAPDGLCWTGVQGVGAGVGGVLLLPLSSFGSAVEPTTPWAQFLVWALIMGVAGSWGATACWVIASRRLPLALAAQLIVAETIFGLAYGFLYEKRWPYPAEWIGGGLQIVGVILAIACFTRPRRA